MVKKALERPLKGPIVVFTMDSRYFRSLLALFNEFSLGSGVLIE